MRTPIPSTPSDEARLLIRVTALANRFASRLLDPDDADDLAQKVVLECVARLRCGRWRVCTSLRGVVRSMVRRRWMRGLTVANNRSAISARLLQEHADGTPEWMDPAAMLELSEAGTVRAQALTELTERCRTAYLLVREEQAPYRDVAAGLGISIGLVAHYVRKAERHLASRVLGRCTPSHASLRNGCRAPNGHRSTTGEVRHRRVVRVHQGGETAAIARATGKAGRAKQKFAEPTATRTRTTASVAETTPALEEANPIFG